MICDKPSLMLRRAAPHEFAELYDRHRDERDRQGQDVIGQRQRRDVEDPLRDGRGAAALQPLRLAQADILGLITPRHRAASRGYNRARVDDRAHASHRFAARTDSRD